jgi:hypothetical protein
MRHARKNVFSSRPPSQSNQTMTLGFCVDCAGESELTKAGVDPKKIWMRGRQSESIDWAISYFRGRPGILTVANDLRVFGPTRKEIFARTAELSRRGITLRDVRQPDANMSELEHKALIAMAASCGTKNHRQARRRGSIGGLAKKASQEAKRNALLNRDIVLRLCAHPKLTWADRSEILGEPFSISSLQRHYRF